MMGKSPTETLSDDNEFNPTNRKHVSPLPAPLTTLVRKTKETNGQTCHIEFNDGDSVFKDTMGSHDPTSHAPRQIRPPRVLFVVMVLNVLLACVCAKGTACDNMCAL